MNAVFGIHDPIGLSYLLQIRVGLSKLNFHKFKHNFRDIVNPMCPMIDGIEDTEHFLLLCPSFDIQRQDLLAGVAELLRQFVQIGTLPNNVLVEYFLYGNEELSNDVNRNILEHTLKFIHTTGQQVGWDNRKLSYATQPLCTFCPHFFCKSVSHLMLGNELPVGTT